MVGMEELQIHSKSYLVRWMHVAPGYTISWSIQPHKKSLNFGVFKHPGGKDGLLPSQPVLPPPPGSSSGTEPTSPVIELPAPNFKEKKTKPKEPTTRNDQSSVAQKLESVGMKCVSWAGKCEADKVSIGTYDVPSGDGGMYGLVFDNTFSKQVSKSATVVLMSFPTAAPLISGHHLHFSQSVGSGGSMASFAATDTSQHAAAQSPSKDSLPKDIAPTATGIPSDPRPRPNHGHLTETKSHGGSTFFTGALLKQRRKHNSYARRFFSLDFASATLSYYQNRNSSALRGAVPISLAVIAIGSEQSREISIDSGAEVWHLKALSPKDFAGWRDALERAKQAAVTDIKANENISKLLTIPHITDIREDHEWDKAEVLVSQVSGIRDAMRRLAKDTDPKYHFANSSAPSAKQSRPNSATPSPSEGGPFDYFREDEARKSRPFWKRKSSHQNLSTSPAPVPRRAFSSQLVVPLSHNPPPLAQPSSITSLNRPPSQHADMFDDDIHEHCMAIFRDLDHVVGAFSSLLAESRRRRQNVKQRTISRRASTASLSEDEWFDAHDGEASRSQLLTIHSSDDEKFTEAREDDDGDDHSGSDRSDFDFDASTFGAIKRRATVQADNLIFPTRPKSLAPLPHSAVQRRSTVPPPKVPPPSLISFLRKNVGKDLSSIAMPVSSNEPTSLLQRVAEQLEYSELLNAAAAQPNWTERLLHVTAFSVSIFSNNRVKERAIRKPFNPLLGETFEMVREDKGFRFIAEKIVHRPVRMACQAEHKDWTFLQTPTPLQKFWGKSAEINTDGRARVLLHSVVQSSETIATSSSNIASHPHSGEIYSWTLATSFLRGIVAGDKYVEPVGTMTVLNETTGAKAVISFKAGGMFAGRSEEVSVQILDGQGQSMQLGLAGKWTSHLNVTKNGADTGRQIWAVGALVDSAPQRYGYTKFAAGLNETTAIEHGKLPPTDSRLRPDQHALEEGELDRAEALKASLEERQRARRRVLEEHGKEWTPQWFVKSGVEGEEEIWRLKSGKDNYWEMRAKKEWSGVVRIFE